MNQKIRSAAFIPLEDEKTEKFKYNLRLSIGKYINDKFIKLKTAFNKTVQGPQLWFQEVDLKAIKGDVSIWLAEAIVEGSVLNFILWVLVGFKFNILTVLAFGAAIKQFLSIYWRLRNNGAPTTIPNKN